MSQTFWRQTADRQTADRNRETDVQRDRLRRSWKSMPHKDRKTQRGRERERETDRERQRSKRHKKTSKVILKISLIATEAHEE